MDAFLKRTKGLNPEYSGTIFIRRNKDIQDIFNYQIFGILGELISNQIPNEKMFRITGYRNKNGDIDIRIHADSANGY
jgi:hypothetical protein